MAQTSASTTPRPLGDLLRDAGLPVPAAIDREAVITAVADDSRRVIPGALFVAIPGTEDDGGKYIPDAIRRGAALIVASIGCKYADIAEAPVVRVGNARLALGHLAHAFHGWPTRDLLTVGVTGTKGKTTTTYLLEAVLGAAGHRPGVIGTIEGRFGVRRWPTETTTPSPVALASIASEMRGAGATALALEASSHGIEQERLAGVSFDAALFTNLSHDHLDYHGSMEKYGAVKKRLFTEGLAVCPGARAVTNIDEPLGLEIAEAYSALGPVTTFGRTPGANVQILAAHATPFGTVLDLRVLGEPWTIESPLMGPGNVQNTAGTIAFAQALGIDRGVIQRGLAECRRIPGRLEPIHEGQPFLVLVDYSHTPASLEMALGQCHALRSPEGVGRVLVVFGCGGDRDALKRPVMGRIAAECADVVWVTSDNPRTENPLAIIDQILQGIPAAAAGRVHVQADRREAIHEALAAAAPGDIVLIAGKGHETYQELNGVKHPFDDAETARAWLREHTR